MLLSGLLCAWVEHLLQQAFGKLSVVTFMPSCSLSRESIQILVVTQILRILYRRARSCWCGVSCSCVLVTWTGSTLFRVGKCQRMRVFCPSRLCTSGSEYRFHQFLSIHLAPQCEGSGFRAFLLFLFKSFSRGLQERWCRTNLLLIALFESWTETMAMATSRLLWMSRTLGPFSCVSAFCITTSLGFWGPGWFL